MADAAGGDDPVTEFEREVDPRDDEELRQTRDAQRAHGGSMAPGFVDPTGHPVAEAPPGTAADERG